MRKDSMELFSLKKSKMHNNGLIIYIYTIFVERIVINYSSCTLRVKGRISVKGNLVWVLKEEFLVIRMVKC